MTLIHTVLVYEFIDNDVGTALILIKPSTRSLVFSSFGKSKTDLLQSGKHFVNKISNKEELFLLRSKEFLKANELEFLEKLRKDFTTLLCGGTTSNIKCEYLIGTKFQCRVWEEVRRITAGNTSSYKNIAHKMGNEAASRAVATALSKNNIALVVPCHRVIGSNGALTGFRWGLDIKRRLLESEGVTVI